MGRSRTTSLLLQSVPVALSAGSVAQTPTFNTFLDTVAIRAQGTGKRSVMELASAAFTGAGVRTSTTSKVDGASDRFKMFWVHTQSDPTKMIKVQDARVSNMVFVEGSVRQSRAMLSSVQASVPVGVDASGPEPAARGSRSVLVPDVDPPIHACSLKEVIGRGRP